MMIITLDGIPKLSAEYLPLQPIGLREFRIRHPSLRPLLMGVKEKLRSAHSAVTSKDFGLWLDLAKKAVDAVEELAAAEHEMARTKSLLGRKEVQSKMNQIKSEWRSYACFAIYLKAYMDEHEEFPAGALLHSLDPTAGANGPTVRVKRTDIKRRQSTPIFWLNSCQRLYPNLKGNVLSKALPVLRRRPPGHPWPRHRGHNASVNVRVRATRHSRLTALPSQVSPLNMCTNCDLDRTPKPHLSALRIISPPPLAQVKYACQRPGPLSQSSTSATCVLCRGTSRLSTIPFRS